MYVCIGVSRHMFHTYFSYIFDGTDVQADRRRSCTYGRAPNAIDISIVVFFKADMKSYIPLEEAAIFFLANLFLKQGISSEYVMFDFICMGKLGLQGAKTDNYKMN